MQEAFIVEAVRTPVGRRNGQLSQEHPIDVAAHVLGAAVERAGVDPETIDDVILGVTDQVGPAAGDIARFAALGAGFPEHVPGVTLDRQCGSSQQAVQFAAQAVMSGTQDVILAGGVQLMSVVPMNIAWEVGKDLVHPDPFSTSRTWQARYGSEEISQFRAAELIAEKWDVSREEMEQFALSSHGRAVAAIDGGKFAGEIAPYGDFDTDECPRRDTTIERMEKLKPLAEDGRITAALASQISDAASVMVIASAAAVERQGLVPRARIHSFAVRGADPVYMLTGPIPATRQVLERAGLKLDDIDLFEVNEAFASVVLAWQRELGADLDKINVNGGAIALGHPIGASGTRLMTSLLNELERTGGRYGLQTMCEGGGQANATVIERV